MSDRSRSVARVQFLGSQRIDIGSEMVTPEAERLFGMIVRLSVPLGRITSRMTMMETLWPGIDEANARHNLRQTVYKARELGLTVESGEDGLRLDPRHWSCDWDDPVGDVLGEWLPNYAPDFSMDLVAWVTAQRVGVHAMLRPRLLRALQTARSAGDLMHADRYAAQLLDIDTLNEEATLTRAEWMAMQGAKVDALVLLDAYLAEIGRVGAGKDAALPAQILRRRIAEKLPAIAYQGTGLHYGPLIGRQGEAKRLIAAIFDARAGRGGAILLQGPDGSGKSRLLFEVKKSACLQGMRVIELATDPAPTSEPFAALRTIVARLLDQPGAMGITPESLAFVRAWLCNTAFSPEECPAAAIEDLMASVSEETPLAILFDNAHRMDADSLVHLDRLYRKGERRYHMLVLASATHATPTETPVELQWIERLPLRPMSLTDVRAIVTMWAGAELPRAKQDQIACASVFAEGVPMYGIEMLGLMLDSGSPDVIPWRVQVGVDRAMRELTELQWRILALCGLLGASARQTTVASALSVGDLELARTMNSLEMSGFVRCEDGILRASSLMSDEAARRITAGIGRLDCSHAATEVEQFWLARRDANDFYSSVRLRISANEESNAQLFLDAEVGTLIRTEPATALVFELRKLRQVALTQPLQSFLDSMIERLLEGSEYKRQLARVGDRRRRVTSLPDVSPSAVEVQYSLASPIQLAKSQQVSRDPSVPPSQRLCEAVEAMIVASNIYDDIAMAAAFGAVNAIRHSTELNPFDLCRADLLYFASVGDRANVLLSAELLVDEARIVRDVSLACKGFRNAAEAFASFGFVDRAQSLLLESRTLAARLAYETSVVSADLRLASLAIFAMDTTGATRYLASAEQSISLHRPSIPLLRADFYLFSCWLALLLGDETAAAKASHGMTRTLRKQNLGTAHAAVTGTRLATHRGKATAELMRGFDTLCNGLLTRTHDCNKEFSLAAVVLFALRHDRRESVQELAHSVLAALVRHGRRPWPYVTELLRR